MRGPDVGGALADHARRRRHLVADERVVAPTLFAASVEPDPAAGVADALGARVPERVVVAPRRKADRLQVGPRIGGGRGGQVEHHEVAGEQPVIARVALDDDRLRRIGRQGKPFHLPGRVVQRARGSAGQIQPGHLGVVPTRARVVGGHDGHDDVGTVPIELPDAAIVRPHLGSLARREVDEEQPASHVAGRSHDRVGVGLGAVDGPGAPIQAVGERIRGQDEQSLTVARTRRGSRPNPAAWPPAPAPRRRRASCREAGAPA